MPQSYKGLVDEKKVRAMSDYRYGTAERDFALFIKEVTGLLGMPCRSDLATVLVEVQRVADRIQELTAWLAQQATDNGFADVDAYAKQASTEESQKGFGRM